MELTYEEQIVWMEKNLRSLRSQLSASRRLRRYQKLELKALRAALCDSQQCVMNLQHLGKRLEQLAA